MAEASLQTPTRCRVGVGGQRWSGGSASASGFKRNPDDIRVKRYTPAIPVEVDHEPEKSCGASHPRTRPVLPPPWADRFRWPSARRANGAELVGERKWLTKEEMREGIASASRCGPTGHPGPVSWIS